MLIASKFQAINIAVDNFLYQLFNFLFIHNHFD